MILKGRTLVQKTASGHSAQIILATIATGAALFWLRDILTPLALAIFLAMMIDAMARAIRSRIAGVPGTMATGLSLGLATIILVLCVLVIANNAAHFTERYGSYGNRLDHVIQKASVAAHLPHELSLSDLIKRANLTKYIGDIAQGLQNFASNLACVLIYMGFIIASGRSFGRKSLAMFPDEQARDRAHSLFLKIRNGVESYLWIQTITGLMIAAASWAAMMAIGLQDAFFWSFLILLASYIPIIGGAVGILIPPLFALVQFTDFWPAVILVALLQIINFVVGNIILPKMQGSSLNIDPVAVLLSLAFWGALWGLPGMFLSTPLTVTLMLVLAQFPASRWIAILLSEDGNPPSHDAVVPSEH